MDTSTPEDMQRATEAVQRAIETFGAAASQLFEAVAELKRVAPAAGEMMLEKLQPLRDAIGAAARDAMD